MIGQIPFSGVSVLVWPTSYIQQWKVPSKHSVHRIFRSDHYCTSATSVAELGERRRHYCLWECAMQKLIRPEVSCEHIRRQLKVIGLLDTNPRYFQHKCPELRHDCTNPVSVCSYMYNFQKICPTHKISLSRSAPMLPTIQIDQKIWHNSGYWGKNCHQVSSLTFNHKRKQVYGSSVLVPGGNLTGEIFYKRKNSNVWYSKPT